MQVTSKFLNENGTFFHTSYPEIVRRMALIFFNLRRGDFFYLSKLVLIDIFKIRLLFGRDNKTTIWINLTLVGSGFFSLRYHNSCLGLCLELQK